MKNSIKYILRGLTIMSGALSFHLFAPLAIAPNNDGGLLLAPLKSAILAR
ncbi:MAG: hypothetical protein V3U57_03025 [Robiginitomaculum sp.]